MNIGKSLPNNAHMQKIQVYTCISVFFFILLCVYIYIHLYSGKRKMYFLCNRNIYIYAILRLTLFRPFFPITYIYIYSSWNIKMSNCVCCVLVCIYTVYIPVYIMYLFVYIYINRTLVHKNMFHIMSQTLANFAFSY